MRAYHRLTECKRNQAYALNKTSLKQNAIAMQISVHKSTVWRELQRHKGLRGYRPKQAPRLASSQQTQFPHPHILDGI